MSSPADRPGGAPEAKTAPLPGVVGLLRERARSGSLPGRRADGCRIALCVEGGGMRGSVSAGMALAIQEAGLLPAFDAVYGSSAGALVGAWLVSSTPEALRGWARPDYARALIRWSAILRGRPVVDIRSLVEEVYQTTFPMDFGSVLASQVPWHPLATDAVTGASTDLRPLVGDPAELRLALRASASMPFLAGPPVELRGRRFYDAGVAESIPLRTPLAQGATHVVVLRTRPAIGPVTDAAASALESAALEDSALEGSALEGTVAGGAAVDGAAPAGAFPAGAANMPRLRRDVSVATVARRKGEVRFLLATVLRRESPELRAAMLTRRARTWGDVNRIAAMAAAGTALSIEPPADGPPVSRLTTDGALLAAAFEAGRAAVLDLGITEPAGQPGGQIPGRTVVLMK
jgi:predicted patatin/cPLA2 family phospholipase